MSLFRRPGESSSDSGSDSDCSELEEQEIEHSRGSTHGSGATEEAVGADLTQTETLSTNEFSVAESEDGVNIPDADRHRNLLLAALLEEFYKTRAAEMMNDMHPGSGFNRQSPEIQGFARSMFAQMSQNMANAGLLPAESVTEDQRHVRATYVAGLDQIRLQDMAANELSSMPEERRLSSAAAPVASSTARPSMALVRSGSRQPVSFMGSMRAQLDQLAYETSNLSMMPHPAADLRLYQTAFSQHSHYRSTFQEKSLLGRGGFGRVYHTYNVFDNCDYAVKKIPLSPKLSQRYRTGGHPELAHMLREVQALAKLDHCNVVRYYATWIEEPTADPNYQMAAFQNPIFQRQKLLEHQPLRSNSPTTGQGRVIKVESLEFDDDDPFDRKDGEDALGPQWSVHAETDNIVSTSGLPESDIFSDGNPHPPRSHEKLIDDPSVYVLHVQMSMYPMTLAQYIAPINSPRSKSFRSSSYASKLHHCFHLVPTLRILLGILAGLQYVHARGMIHRDIKPSNIFMSAKDYAFPGAGAEGYADVGNCNVCHTDFPRSINPRIGDFGLVADLERAAADERRASLGHSRSDSGSGSAKAVGTEYYRPPPPPYEYHDMAVGSNSNKRRAKPHPNNEALDVFALGVTLVELLCPCHTRMERIEMLSECQRSRAPACLKERLLKQEACPRDVADMVEACVHGMIDADPNRRWSCSIIKNALEGILSRYSGDLA